MRRKTGELVLFEKRILKVAKGLHEFYGYQIAEKLGHEVEKRGTLYRALNRLEKFGYLKSRWEDNPIKNVPRRKYYRLTDKSDTDGTAIR